MVPIHIQYRGKLFRNQTDARVVMVLAFFYLVAHIDTRAQSIPDRWNYPYTLHEKAEIIKGMPVGPFARISDREIICGCSDSGKEVLISEDNGKTWKPYPVFKSDKYSLGSVAIAYAGDGVVVLAFSNPDERFWDWNDDLKDAPNAKLPTYVVRSTDYGRTWSEPLRLHDDWTGENTHMIVTEKGNIVFTSMMMRHNPARHTVLTYMSEDKGKTWHRSNIIDMGGAGHHGGVTETTIIQLKDGRLMGLMRTNWMTLWRIESNDEGKTWHPYGPSGIPAASTHARLLRLSSGRILLVWNRPYPEGTNTYELRGGDNIWSETPVSNYRGEMSVAFSEDEGKTWSEPVVIAKTDPGGYRAAGVGGTNPVMPNREVSYPFAFEIAPGEIWITSRRGPVRVKIYEKDFLRPVKK